MLARVLLAALALFAGSAHAACSGSSPTRTAASASYSDVNDCITAASAGDTINIPAGTATWSTTNAVTLDKALTLNGAGTSSTIISFSTQQSFNITKQSSGVIRIKNIKFQCTSWNGPPHVINIGGPWPSGDPVIFENNVFTMNGCTMISAQLAGGFIAANNTFTTSQDNDFAFSFKDQTHTSSWTTADTMGTADTTGKNNIYIEDNTFSWHNNGLLDCDDNCRLVFRYNTVTGGGPNSHGKDTSNDGMRHFEIYNNAFQYTDTSQNTQQYIWIRGGTGVIIDNSFQNITGSTWGDKNEIRISIRAAEDARVQGDGTCGAVSSPIPHQSGRGHNGTSELTVPIYIYGNTGTFVVVDQFDWGNPCGFTWTTFFQWGRDGYKDGTTKSGYTKYTYPHPLIAGKLQGPGNPRWRPAWLDWLNPHYAMVESWR